MLESAERTTDGYYLITPALAFGLLAKNHRNRTLRKGTVEFYARQMKAGTWRRNPQPIIVDEADELIDGQHRLQAVVESDTAIWFKVDSGCADDVRSVVDTGRSRTPGDVLSMLHPDLGGFAVDCSSTARGLILWERRPTSPFGAIGATFPGGKVPNAEIEAYFASHCEIILAAVRRWKMLSRAHFTGGASFWGPLLSEFSLKDEEATEVFVELLASGANMNADHPILLLHNRLLEMSHSRYQMKNKNDVAALVIRAWNAWREGRTMGKLIGMRIMDKFPQPI